MSTVLVIEADGSYRIQKGVKGSSGVQKLVGGYFALFPHKSPETARYIAYCDDEGLDKNLQYNALANHVLRKLGFDFTYRTICGGVVGNVVIALNVSDERDLLSESDEEIDEDGNVSRKRKRRKIITKRKDSLLKRDCEYIISLCEEYRSASL